MAETHAQAALEEAYAGLSRLYTKDLVEVRDMVKPQQRLQDVLTCVAVLKGLQTPAAWGTIKKMLACTHSDFLDSLRTISSQDLSEAQLGEVKALLEKDSMTPAKVDSMLGKACLAWVLALMRARER